MKIGKIDVKHLKTISEGDFYAINDRRYIYVGREYDFADDNRLSAFNRQLSQAVYSKPQKYAPLGIQYLKTMRLLCSVILSKIGQILSKLPA